LVGYCQDLGDDVVTDEHGNPQIGEGTAPDRIISLTEPEMRHGRKSSAHRFDGFKVVVAVERKIAELVSHGLRFTRYVGQPKRQLQRLWIGAAVNLRRLFTLAQVQKVDLFTLPDHLAPPLVTLMTT
jgi:hypothetical protein